MDATSGESVQSITVATPDERRGCWDCGWSGGWVSDAYDSEGEWAGAEWIDCPCQVVAVQRLAGLPVVASGGSGT